MTLKVLATKLILVLAGSLVLGYSACAQQAKTSDLRLLRTYDTAREVNLTGTVVKYDAASALPPLGAHVLVQTLSGNVDVHLGSAKVLVANHFVLNAGDSVRIVGESMALGDGTYFAARILQKGVQAVAVRNAKGFLTTSTSEMSQAQSEALRGVR